MLVMVVRVPIETFPTMKTHMAIRKYLLLRVHQMRLMEGHLKGVVAAMVDPVVHFLVAVEVVTAMEMLEKEIETALVGLLSAVVELAVGMCETGVVEIVYVLLSVCLSC